MLYPTELQGRKFFSEKLPSRSGETNSKNVRLLFFEFGRRLEREEIIHIKERLFNPCCGPARKHLLVPRLSTW